MLKPYQIPCATGSDYNRQEGTECAFCNNLPGSCRDPLVCHGGVCRNPTNPDVACERGGYVFDYLRSECTSERAPFEQPATGGGAPPSTGSPSGSSSGTNPLFVLAAAAAGIAGIVWLWPKLSQR